MPVWVDDVLGQVALAVIIAGWGWLKALRKDLNESFKRIRSLEEKLNKGKSK